VLAAAGHGISSAPHRRATPDRWTPRRPLRRHPRPHFCPIGTVSPLADRCCHHEGSLVSALLPAAPNEPPTSPAISPTHGPTSPRRCSPDPASAFDRASPLFSPLHMGHQPMGCQAVWLGWPKVARKGTVSFLNFLCIYSNQIQIIQTF
jgi:hypothetical protein